MIPDINKEFVSLQGNDMIMENNHIHHVCEEAAGCGAIRSGNDWTYVK